MEKADVQVIESVTLSFLRERSLFIGRGMSKKWRDLKFSPLQKGEVLSCYCYGGGS